MVKIYSYDKYGPGTRNIYNGRKTAQKSDIELTNCATSRERLEAQRIKLRQDISKRKYSNT